MSKASEIKFRCTDVEKAEWSEKAEDAGYSLSDWIRARLNDVVQIEEGAAFRPAAKPTLRPARAPLPRYEGKANACPGDVSKGTKCKLCGKMH